MAVLESMKNPYVYQIKKTVHYDGVGGHSGSISMFKIILLYGFFFLFFLLRKFKNNRTLSDRTIKASIANDKTALQETQSKNEIISVLSSILTNSNNLCSSPTGYKTNNIVNPVRPNNAIRNKVFFTSFPLYGLPIEKITARKMYWNDDI